MKNDKKIYDVTVQVVTDIPFQVLASSEEDAREQIVDEVHSVNYKHFLREIDGGIEMEDIIHYKIPLGFIGEFLNFLFIKNQLKEIFEYRKNKLIEIFGEIS